MPAEWEVHAATWIGWPHNTRDWPGKFAPIPWVYGEIVRALSPGEMIHVIVDSAAHESSARRSLEKVGVNPATVRYFRFPTDRGWTRDFGPMFLRREDPVPELAVNNFRFNGWAKYPDHRKDRTIHARGARALGLRLFQAGFPDRPFVLEGGAIDVNGQGSLLTTEECLLDQSTQTRNPGLSRGENERILGASLGIRNVIWLGAGIAGDDTHGHVDDLARFVNPTTIVLADEKNPVDPNYRALRENRERLEGARLENGSAPRIVALPMPAPLIFNGVRLPASYANFYIGNQAVLVPTFNDPMDRIALGILSELFSPRPVKGIHAVDLVWGLGTIHCLTQQQPAL
jgi:agmatine deiminase